MDLTTDSLTIHWRQHQVYYILKLCSSESLDGKEVTETSRQFLKNWQANKEAQKKKRQSGGSRQTSGQKKWQYNRDTSIKPVFLMAIGMYKFTL